MCSVLTHPVIPVALSVYFPEAAVSPSVMVIGTLCSILPDLDVIGFRFGIRYQDMLGHRGLTHSLVFAGALAALLTLTVFRHHPGNAWLRFLFLFLATVSHPLLDMLTNGGLGVALFAPWSNKRYFFPWRPIEVSPIGIGSFFSTWGVRVFWSELRWVWGLSTVVFVLGFFVRRFG